MVLHSFTNIAAQPPETPLVRQSLDLGQSLGACYLDLLPWRHCALQILMAFVNCISGSKVPIGMALLNVQAIQIAKRGPGAPKVPLAHSLTQLILPTEQSRKINISFEISIVLYIL